MVTQTDLKFAQRLRKLRLSSDIKQEHAAQLLGLASQQVYSRLENGQTPFSEEIINKICKKFKVSRREFTDLSIDIRVQNNLDF